MSNQEQVFTKQNAIATIILATNYGRITVERMMIELDKIGIIKMKKPFGREYRITKNDIDTVIQYLKGERSLPEART